MTTETMTAEERAESILGRPGRVCGVFGKSQIADAIRSAENAAYENAAEKARSVGELHRAAAKDWRRSKQAHGVDGAELYEELSLCRAWTAEQLEQAILALRHPDTKET